MSPNPQRRPPPALSETPQGPELRLVDSTPALEIQERSNRWDFARLEPQWNQLAKGTAPFSQHAFLRIWLDNFAPRQNLRLLLAYDNRELVGALPLIEGGTFLGLPVRQLTAAANPHSCRFDLLATEPERVGRAFFERLAARHDWDVLRISDVPDGGGAWHLYRAAQEAKFPVGIWESMRSPYLPLPKVYSSLEERLQGKFRSNLRRRRRRLSERGEVRVERVTGGPDLDARLEEGLALERSGWKGQRGTAIAQDRGTHGFYSELARSASYAGRLSMFFLRLDGRAIAFHYGLQKDQRYFLLKPAYAEDLAECSPGQLLMEEVLRDCVARGIEELDFLGPDMPWKRDWTQHTRVHHWLFVFRDHALGRALRRAKFDWLPALKRTLSGRRE